VPNPGKAGVNPSLNIRTPQGALKTSLGLYVHHDERVRFSDLDQINAGERETKVQNQAPAAV
jgi:hypothetical protein